MEAKNDGSYARSLPPLVEGKVHGYLRLVIDEIVWCRRSPGDVTVIASWWGELDSAHFRPADIKNGDISLDRDISETYAIRTNLDLFEEYLTNCETVELVVISEKSHRVVGTARATELYNVLSGKSHFQYVPIVNDSGSRIGDIHATMKLQNVPRNQKSPSKIVTSKKMSTDDKIWFDDTNIMANHWNRLLRTDPSTKNTFPCETDVPVAIKNAKHNENIYRSILKPRKYNLENASSCVNDNLVAQVVARAQRLRGAIMKETREDDALVLSDDSSLDGVRRDRSLDDEAALYEYFLGNKMTRRDEKKALEALRSTSPTPSLINLASEAIRTCANPKNSIVSVDRSSMTKTSERTVESLSLPNSAASSRPKQLRPIDYVDSLRIFVESLSLSPAGWRRVKSSCMSRGDGIPISVTYFVHYDATFVNLKKSNRKLINDNKPTKLCSKKQIDRTIYFNHEAVYDYPKIHSHTDQPLRFKIFHRHLNQRAPTELGAGSMRTSDVWGSENLTSAQRLAIVNKGMKIGELKVTVELGCDKIHFGKQFVESVTSAKENIPIDDNSSHENFSLTNCRPKRATGNHEKTDEKSSSTSKSAMKTRRGHDDRVQGHEMSNDRTSRDDDAENDDTIVVDRRNRDTNDTNPLQCLIYVEQGKGFHRTTTFLRCKAFSFTHRRTETSRTLMLNNNPHYYFHQLTNFSRLTDMIERAKNNFVVVEIRSYSDNGDDLSIGEAKLSVHEFYVAYSDPDGISHSATSKLPIISVDGWVNVINPANGKIEGQIKALVALGTEEQIRLLETTRSLKRSNSCSPNRTVDDHRRASQNFRLNVDNTNFHVDETVVPKNFITQECQTDMTTVKYFQTQECQTEISAVKYFKTNGTIDETTTMENPQSLTFNGDRLDRMDFDSSARIVDYGKSLEIEPLKLGTSTNVSFSDESDAGHRENFHPDEVCRRSVGVGAEFDDDADRGPSTSYANVDNDRIAKFSTVDSGNREAIVDYESPAIGSSSVDSSTANKHNDMTNLESENFDNTSFRAVVEIECALRLPKIERSEDFAEPCTYVTFQRARNREDSQYDCYVVTDVCTWSCCPRWNWRCDTRLSNDLLENEEKRLILKVWRLSDPDTSMQIDLERDVVIGFSAIDLSVLTVGFPVVSGWFHVMDFTGKCNGQIKMSVTPLDNIADFGKLSSACNAAESQLPDFDRSNFSSPYPDDLRKNDNLDVVANSEREKFDEAIINPINPMDNEPIFDIGLNDASMSFLSLSLKKKLTELDVIKNRLESRLHDVTDTAFNDDYDNDFDLSTIIDSDRENNDNSNNPKIRSNPENSNVILSTTNGNPRKPYVDNFRKPIDENSPMSDVNSIETGYSTVSQSQSHRTLTNDNRNRSETDESPSIDPNPSEATKNVVKELAEISSNAGEDEQPIKGQKMHISHLLDRLTTQLTAVPVPTPDQTTKTNIIDLLNSLRRNNFSNNVKCNREINVTNRTNQTDKNFNRDEKSTKTTNQTENKDDAASSNDNENLLDDDQASAVALPSKTNTRIEKISKIVRDELIDSEDLENDCERSDELSAHLVASNVRHMDFNRMFNPLIYGHVIPDSLTTKTSEERSRIDLDDDPENLDVQSLDTRYAKNFDTKINERVKIMENLNDVDEFSACDENFATTSDNDGFRATPSGLSDNIDGNIDVTVVHKPCDDELMASNESVESTTTISLERGSNDVDCTSSFDTSETSVYGSSRQAPDGGNPVEDSGVAIVGKRIDDCRDTSSGS